MVDATPLYGSTSMTPPPKLGKASPPAGPAIEGALAGLLLGAILAELGTMKEALAAQATFNYASNEAHQSQRALNDIVARHLERFAVLAGAVEQLEARVAEQEQRLAALEARN
jgi:hypothetical protein